MTEIITIEKKYTHENEEQYFYIPFNAPSGVEKFSIELTREGKGTLDLGLIFPDGTQNGASGGRTNKIVISERYATPGYTPSVIIPGRWKVILGVYRVESEVTAKIRVTLYYSEPKWLKGDTHVHTVNSDGGCTPFEILKKCEKKGFDFVFITDHNNCRAHYCNLQSEKVNVIRGMELTLYAGHINLFGVKEPIKQPYCASTDEELKVLLDEAKANGAMISINHPECKLCGYHLGRDIDAKAVEVWNGPMRIDEVEAIKWWHNELLKENRITAIGGSDYHRDYYITDLLGLPTTFVYSKSGNSEDIQDAIEKGRCVVSSGVKGPFIEMKCGTAIIGDEVEFTDNTLVRICCKNVIKGQTLNVFNNDEIIYSKVMTSDGNFECTVKVKFKGFVRAEFNFIYKGIVKKLYKKVLHFILPQDDALPLPYFASCLTNPIYFK